jgi:hypothetical protein
MTREAFALLTGAFDNIGDAVLRRRSLEWARGFGPVHGYVSGAPQQWIDELGFADDESIYRRDDRKSWFRRLLFTRGVKPALIFDPGEQSVERQFVKTELAWLLFCAIVKLRRGVIVRPPRALRPYDRGVAAIHRLSCRISDVVLWREPRTAERMRVGRLVPDIGFSEGPWHSDSSDAERDVLVISLRGPRAFPGDDWFEGVSAFARKHSLRIVALSQVREDEDRCRELVERFGEDLATHEQWGDRSNLEHERVVREIYSRTLLSISDRLHVLIVSAREGAVPVELVARPTSKVTDHFGVIGYRGLSRDATSLDASAVNAFLAEQVDRTEELRSALSAAERVLADAIAAAPGFRAPEVRAPSTR